MALVAEIIPKERLGEGLGYFGLGQVVSQVIGPVIGVAMKEHMGFRALFYTVAVISAFAVVLLFLFPYDSSCHDSSKTEKEIKVTFPFGI